MKVEFSYTEEEYVHLRQTDTPWQLARRIGRYEGRTVGWGLHCLATLVDFLGLAALFIATVGLWHLHPIGYSGLALLLIISCCNVIQQRRSVRGMTALRKEFHSNVQNAGGYAVSVNERGITWAAPMWTAEIEWRGVLRFSESPEAISLIDATPRLLVIPARAFESPRSRAEFIAAVTSGMRAAQRSAQGEVDRN